jgi:hypothetical protein
VTSASFPFSNRSIPDLNGLLANLVDTDRPIALTPDKLMYSLQKTQVGITKPHG